jgi:FkbM family methyltransferase
VHGGAQRRGGICVKPLKSVIQRGLRRLGYDLHRHIPALSGDAQRTAILRTLRIDLVLDVGANAGQFARSLRASGYAGRIVSFEPLAAVRRALLAASAGDDLWTVAERAAIGDRAGDIEMHVSANSVSSSALEMLDAHTRSAPESRYVGVERVPLRRLDDIAAAYCADDSRVLLKIDTQGFEDRVLEGAAGILPRVSAIQAELSLVPLYAGQKLLPEMLGLLRESGFAPWAMWPAFVEPGTGRSLQIEAIFARSAGDRAGG